MSSAPVAPEPPGLPDDLPAAEVPPELHDVVLERCLIENLDLSNRETSRLEVLESRLVQADLSGSNLTGGAARDLIAIGGSWANSRADGARLSRVQFENVRLTGISLANSSIQDATFVECRVDLASFRFAKLERVRFESCRMEEADFYDVRFSSVLFEDCALTGALWAGAAFTRSEIRRCDLSGGMNMDRLRGVRMPWPDVINAAGDFAAAVGIEIIE